MSKHTFLPGVRARLDKAITYGSKLSARKIAREGLLLAEKKNLTGEMEYFKGQREMLREKFVSAMEHFDAAIKYNPKDGGSYNDQALCLAELGLVDQALVCFDKGIAVEADYATIYHNKGWLLNNLGRYSEALIYLKKALRLEPGRAVTYDNLADALYNLGDYNGALEAYEKVLELLKPRECLGIKKEIRLRMVEIRKMI